MKKQQKGENASRRKQRKAETPAKLPVKFGIRWINWPLLAGYLFGIAAVFVCKYYLQFSHQVFAILAVVIIGTAPVSVFLTWLFSFLIQKGVVSYPSSRLLSFRYSMQEVTMGWQNKLILRVENPYWFILGNTSVLFQLENRFYPNQDLHCIDLGLLGFREKREEEFPIGTTHCGQVNATSVAVAISDYFRLVEFVIPVTSERVSMSVMPNITPTTPDLSESSGGSEDEAEENQKKGYTSSEVRDIREYIPGDKLNAIHWKLSAKAGELMVKEYESMSAEHFQIIPEFSTADANTLDKTLELLYSIGNLLIHEQGLGFTVYYWSETEQKIVPFAVWQEDDVAELFERIYADRLPAEDRSSVQFSLDYFRNQGVSRSGYAIYVTPGSTGDGEMIFRYEELINVYEIFS